MAWQPFLCQRNYGYRCVPHNHHPQNNLRVSYPGYVVSMIYGLVHTESGCGQFVTRSQPNGSRRTGTKPVVVITKLLH